MLKRSLIVAFAAGLLSLGGCGSGGDSQAVADDDLSANDSDNGDDDEQLATAVQCAVQLEMVAKLPASEIQSDVTEESASPDESAAEHASLADLYRAQAREMARSMGRSAADLDGLYRQAAAEITRQRKARTPGDFAGWIGGEADECPAIQPDGPS